MLGPVDPGAVLGWGAESCVEDVMACPSKAFMSLEPKNPPTAGTISQLQSIKAACESSWIHFPLDNTGLCWLDNNELLGSDKIPMDRLAGAKTCWVSFG